MPRVRSLLGHRVGDNAQVQTLVDALKWPSERKTLQWKKPLPFWTPLYGRQANLRHLVEDSRKSFVPPWPDVVISVGWRSIPVARWIKKQSGARLIHIGRPRAPLKYFDLVLTTPQYRLPDTKNVLQLDGPMTALSKTAFDLAASQWQERLSHLPRPWIAVLIGGNARPFHLPSVAAIDIAEKCNDLASNLRGSLLITTGPRTPSDTLKTVMTQISVPNFSHDWHVGGDNPYQAFLAMADRIVVTSESILMAQEAVSTGRQVYLYLLPKTADWHERALRPLSSLARNDKSWTTGAIDALVRNGLLVLPRYAEEYSAKLVAKGHAAFLGTCKPVSDDSKMENQTDLAVQAVRELISPARK